GVASCRNCHSRETTPSAAAFQHERDGGMSPFCELVQARTWQESDKHSQSFQLLVDTPAKRELVNRILGFDLTSVLTRDDQGNFDGLISPQSDTDRGHCDTVKACLRCHATWPKTADNADSPYRRPVKLADGVSCEACHGPSEAWN